MRTTLSRRRTALALATTTLICLGGAGVSTTATAATEPLRDLAADHGLVIGAAVNATALAGEVDYRTVLAREFSSVTAENVMKWEVLEPQPDQYNWGPADALVNFAQQHGQQVRGHALVWHSQNPPWIQSLSPTDLRAALYGNIDATVGRYKGRVQQWDVVNEPLASNGTLADTIWKTKLGTGYIEDAFRRAHAADPNAKLYINDFYIEGLNTKSDGMYNLVKDLLARGVPIHGVGFQTHITTDGRSSSFKANLERFAALGLDVAITEMDVRMLLPADATKLAKQSDLYEGTLRDCLDVPRCRSFTLWGFTDKHSWIPKFYPGYGAALPYDANLNPKPAYYGLQSALVGPRVGPIVGIGGKCVDVPNVADPSGKQLQIWTCAGTANQQWTVADDGTLRSLGRCMDVRGGATANGTVVQLLDCNGSGAQQWQANGTALVNTASGKCLDVGGGSSADGSKLQIWQCFGNTNQRWTFP